MKKLLATSLVFLGTIFSLIVPDRNSAAQDNKYTTIKNIEMKIIMSKWEGLYLSTGQSYDLKMSNKNRERSYSFLPNGKLMVFIGTSDYDRMSKSTGSRTYHLLPFKERREPSFSRKDESTVEGYLPSGYTALFSSETGELLGIEGFTVTMTPVVHFDEMVKSRGGVEIRPQKGYILVDYGWRTGETSSNQLWSPSAILDGYGNRCAIKNSDISMRDPRDSDEVVFKFKNNQELDKFMKVKCPKIVWQ
ncbi:MAG TPA: hypothetical protein PLD91_18925 [Spirochaetota bacterium]|nr:hypothetical protein [Spirochaetota bacterium]HRS78701.1 hypothetical protein [Spirochaetota bacterium]HRT76647.1 hypothetical protein [Spirochaetota bacterium]